MQKSLLIVLLISGLACAGCAVSHSKETHLSAEEYAAAKKFQPRRSHPTSHRASHPTSHRSWQRPYISPGFVGGLGGIGGIGGIAGPAGCY